MNSSDQWKASAPIQSAFRSKKTGGGQMACRVVRPGAVFRKSDRNNSTSSSIRPTTPARVAGLSTLECRIPATLALLPARRRDPERLGRRTPTS